MLLMDRRGKLTACVNPLGRLLDPELVQRVSHLAVSARRVAHGATGGRHKSPLRGASVEFRQHRSYAAGDEPRSIDWRVLARTDRTYVKEYDEESNLHATLLLDASGSMAYGKPASKFVFAQQLVAAVAYLLLAANEAAGLQIAAATASPAIAPATVGSQLARIITLLEAASPAGQTTLQAGLISLANSLRRRSLVLIVTDALLPIESLQSGLARLAHDRHEIVLLRTLHPDEIHFPFRSWTQFAGLESESPRRADGARLRKTYLENFHRHEIALRTLCGSLGIDMLAISTDGPLVDAITHLVRRNGSATFS